MADDEKVARLRASFNRFDKDGSGFIDRQEMREVVKGMYEGLDVPESMIIAEADHMIRESNKVGVADDKISFEEFVALFSK